MVSMVIYENFKLKNSRFYQKQTHVDKYFLYSILIRLYAYKRTTSDLLHKQNIGMKNYRNWLPWKQSKYMVIIKLNSVFYYANENAHTI